MLLSLQTQGWLGDTIHNFWMQRLRKVYIFFSPENMQGKIVFQSDLINDGKQFTGPVLLLWMEEGGESSSGQNPYATLHNWSSSLAGKQALQACSRIPLICCETSTSDYLFQLLSLVNSRKRKGAAWDNTDTVLLKANKACDLVTFMKNYLITDKSCSCIHLVKPWFYEGEEKCAFFFFFFFLFPWAAMTVLSWGLLRGRG